MAKTQLQIYDYYVTDEFGRNKLRVDRDTAKKNEHVSQVPDGPPCEQVKIFGTPEEAE